MLKPYVVKWMPGFDMHVVKVNELHEACLSHLQYWLCLNVLCLNPDKTDAIILAMFNSSVGLPAKINVAGCHVPISNI